MINTISTYDETGRRAWRDWREAVARDGVESLHDRLMARWFTPEAIRDQAPGIRYMSEALRSFSATTFAWIAHAIIHDLDYATDLQHFSMPTFIVATPDDPGIPKHASE